MRVEIKNAKITKTTLGFEDHGIFTAYVLVEGDGWGCGFGGYAMDSWNKDENRRIGTAFGIEFISSVLNVVGVETWEELTGNHVRVETEGWGGRILKIGHITENRWFDPKMLSQKFSN